MIKRIAFFLSMMILTSCEIEEEGKCHLYCEGEVRGNWLYYSVDYEKEVIEKECLSMCDEAESDDRSVCNYSSTCTFCLDNDCKEVN